MAIITKINDVLAGLRAQAAKAMKDSNAAVVVGYTQSYAVYVHENLNAHHPVGQAKFLSDPAESMKDQLREIIKAALKANKTLAQGMLLAGLALQRASQKLCPVDTGALRASAFTRIEKGS